MGTESDDLRTTLEQAYEANETPAEPAPAREAPPPEPEQTRGSPGEPAGEPADRGDGRDAQGRFAPKARTPAPEGEEAAKPVTEEPPQRTTPSFTEPKGEPLHDPFARPPQSWRPQVREAWNQLPAPVREEVYRREREVAGAMQESAQARQVLGHLESLQQAYAPALQAEGVNVLQATQNLMGLASRMRFGTPVEKAQTAAQFIRLYAVDEMAIALALDAIDKGQMPAPQAPRPAAPQPMYDPRVTQLLEQREQQVRQSATQSVEEFGRDKEFFEDVREDMADLMDVAAKRGIDMDLARAYAAACRLNPDIAKVLDSRSAASRTGTSNEAIRNARHAASSVRGTPSSGSTPTRNASDLRGTIEAAFDEVSGR
jgi:hypothetical protein